MLRLLTKVIWQCSSEEGPCPRDDPSCSSAGRHQGVPMGLDLGSQVPGFALSLLPPPALMLRALTCRNWLAGCWNFPSISQIRVSRWDISSETFATASSWTLVMAWSRSTSWVRRRRSWSFKNWCNCSNSHTIFFPSVLVFSCQGER